MQDLGYIVIHNVEVNVLYWQTENGKALKLRSSSMPKGNYLEDESEYLKDKPTLVMDLIDGQTINL